MTSLLPGVRRSLTLLAAGTFISAAAAAAQDRDAAPRPANLPPGAVVQPLGDGMGEELRRHVAALGDNPRSMTALIGAGRAALAMGDPQAALTFFSRADEISPRDARAKAGMAAAFARLERGQAALDLFAEAAALGAPEAEIAADRGLAYDIAGDPARAQRDYTIALRHRDDPEIRRRLAISLAISGQRDAALRVIDAQLREQDRAAWRTQALVLALTGDPEGAGRTASGVMPPAAVRALTPFLARMASLDPAQKALAAHFGHFPGNGANAVARSGSVSADPGALAFAQGGTPAGAAPSRDSAPVSTAPRRRPDLPPGVGEREGIGLRPQYGDARRQQRAREAAPAQPREIAQLETRRAPSPPPAPEPASNPPVSSPSASQSSGQPLARFQPNGPSGGIPAGSGVAGDASPGFSLTPAGPQPGTAAAPAAGPPVVAVPLRPFAEIAELVSELPRDAPPPDPPPAPPVRVAEARPQPRAEAAAPPQPAPARTQRPRVAAQPAHPSRHWVQIAGGANKATLPREFARLRALAPDLLGRQQAWTTPLNATNRLLVGPFPSAREAQAFVNRLAVQDLAAFAWTSPAGQEIERLQTR